MKKLVTLLLAAGMTCAVSAPASAVDVKMDGQYLFTFISGERIGSGDNYDMAGQRLRLGMTFTASENLSGYLQLQAGISQNANNGYDWGTDDTGRNSYLAVRQSYIDWMIPQTTIKVRMGKHLFGLPEDAFGKNAIMHPGWAGRDGIVLTSPVTDWLGLTAFWNRGAYDNGEDDIFNNDTVHAGKTDFFGLAADMKFDGFSFTPYVMYGAVDRGADVKASTDASAAIVSGKPATLSADGNAYWFGATAAMTYFDPFVLKISGAYGLTSYEGSAFMSQDDKVVGEMNMNDRSGWYVQAKASYKTAYGTPVLGAWYGSGDDSDSQYARQGWIPTNNGRFHPTVGFTAGEYGLYDPTVRHNIAGTWGVQIGLEDVSFLEDLTHDFTVTMFKGTNSDKWSSNMAMSDYYMTNSDTAVEFNISNTYQIYKNLAANLELAYIINDFDKDDHSGVKMDKDGWDVALSFAYKF